MTIQDVAKLAGVSSATISRVLNNDPRVKPQTKQRAMEAIKQLNYTPNLLGRNLRRTQTRMILLVLPTISNPYYGQLVKGMEDTAHKNDNNVLLCNTDYDIKRERLYVDLLKHKLADGAIFMQPEISECELSELAEKIPVVQCSEYREGANVSIVAIDNIAAACKATNHLLRLGHKRIALITGVSHVSSSIKRKLGYEKALFDAGIPLDPSIIKIGDYSFKSGLRNTKQLLAMKDPPTAILCMSDIMAIGSIRAAKDGGLKVPEDLAVMGFDNIDFASMSDPELTTIEIPKYDLGCMAMNLLLRFINGESDKPENIFLEHELIIRTSTMK